MIIRNYTYFYSPHVLNFGLNLTMVLANGFNLYHENPQGICDYAPISLAAMLINGIAMSTFLTDFIYSNHESIFCNSLTPPFCIALGTGIANISMVLYTLFQKNCLFPNGSTA